MLDEQLISGRKWEKSRMTPWSQAWETEWVMMLVTEVRSPGERSRLRKMTWLWKCWIWSALGRPGGGPTWLEHCVNPAYLPHHLGPSPCPPRAWKTVHQITGISALGARSKFFSFLYPSSGIGTQKLNMCLLNCTKFTEILPLGNEKGVTGDGRPEKQLWAEGQGVTAESAGGENERRAATAEHTGAGMLRNPWGWDPGVALGSMGASCTTPWNPQGTLLLSEHPLSGPWLWPSRSVKSGGASTKLWRRPGGTWGPSTESWRANSMCFSPNCRYQALGWWEKACGMGAVTAVRREAATGMGVPKAAWEHLAFSSSLTAHFVPDLLFGPWNLIHQPTVILQRLSAPQSSRAFSSEMPTTGTEQASLTYLEVEYWLTSCQGDF